MDYNYLEEPWSEDEDFIELYNIVNEPGTRKTIRERPDHFQKWNDSEFIARFRLSKQAVMIVHNKIKNEISTTTLRNNAVNSILMLLLTLRFFATGSMLIVIGDFCGIDKSTVSKIVHKVSRAIARLRPEYIKYPETPEEISKTREGFFRISKFPRCIGAVDCTHIKIQSPGGNNAEIYRNRKGFFSFNVQVVSDSNLKIQDIVVRWPGSAHDATIFNNSSIYAKFENHEMGDNLIVGDSGYAIKPYLITPLANPTTPAEQLFNESKIRTRTVVERCFGVWKRRFPILAYGIRSKIDRVEAIVVATAVLHNIARDLNLAEPVINEDGEEAVIYVNNVPVDNVLHNNAINNSVRYALIHDYYTGLL